jgi:dihydrofolate reductase
MRRPCRLNRASRRRFSPDRPFPRVLRAGAAGGEEGRDNDIARETFERTGASVMGKRMFDAGERMWPEDAPFHTPVFVVTHEKRDPLERPGGFTFHFVTDGIEAALDQAREAADDRDVRIAGGAATILEYVNASLIDEFSIALSPRAVRLRNWPVRGRGRGPRGPGAGPRGAIERGAGPDQVDVLPVVTHLFPRPLDGLPGRLGHGLQPLLGDAVRPVHLRPVDQVHGGLVLDNL